MYHWENLVGPFSVHKFLGHRPPPLPSITSLGPNLGGMRCSGFQRVLVVPPDLKPPVLTLAVLCTCGDLWQPAAEFLMCSGRLRFAAAQRWWALWGSRHSTSLPLFGPALRGDQGVVFRYGSAQMMSQTLHSVLLVHCSTKGPSPHVLITLFLFSIIGLTRCLETSARRARRALRISTFALVSFTECVCLRARIRVCTDVCVCVCVLCNQRALLCFVSSILGYWSFASLLEFVCVCVCVCRRRCCQYDKGRDVVPMGTAWALEPKLKPGT